MPTASTNRFLDFVPAGVRTLKPYVPGKPVEELEREYGVRDALKLASNENPLGTSPRALEVVRRSLSGLERYPDDGAFALKSKLAARHGVTMAQITLGNGSSNVLDLVARAFVAPGNEMVFSQHAFLLYPIIAQACGARAVMTPATGWGHDLDAMLAAITPATRLVFIANPNNPTGTWLRGAQLEGFLQRVPPHVIVLVDEAYFEYAIFAQTGAVDYPDAMAWVGRYDNLVVTRTFSKAYGLAGLRVGYAVSHADVADLLGRIRQPFNVNSLALLAAQAALDDQEFLTRSQATNAQGMRQLNEGLRGLGLSSIPSAANFLCVDVARDARALYDALLRQGVIVRPSADMPTHLRITIGLPTENERVLAALHQVLKS